MTCQVCGSTENVKAKSLPEGLCKTCRIWYTGWMLCRNLFPFINYENKTS